MKQAIIDILNEEESTMVHGYMSNAGFPQVRKTIADNLNMRYGTAFTEKNLIMTVGAGSALNVCLKTLVNPGEEVIVFAPYFVEYNAYVRNYDGNVVIISPDTETFMPKLDEFEAKITARTKAVIINNPHNPTGVVYREETIRALAEILKEKQKEYGHAIYLLSDEPYRELAYGVEVPFLPEIYRDTVICYSYSKSLSLPGERIGYVYVPQKATDGKALYSAVAGAARAGGHVCAPSLWQKVIARCAHLRPDLESYDRNRKALYEGLTRMGYEMAKPDGAFYLFIKAPGGDANAFSDAAKKKDLLVVPGDGFGCPGYFRICYCVSLKMIQKSLPVFEELIRCGEW